MGEMTREGDPAQDLWLRWRRGERPVVARFLAGRGDLAPSRLAAVLRVDQRERWMVGERVPAAEYLREFPTLRDDPEAAVELIYGEFLLRKELGEAPALEEYQRDHPDFAARLAIQVELHRALEDQADERRCGGYPTGRRRFARVRTPTLDPLRRGRCRPRRGTRSWRCSGKGAWASSTRPVTPGCAGSWL